MEPSNFFLILISAPVVGQIDVESFFCLFISLLGKLGLEKVLQRQESILQSITSDPTQKPALRLTMFVAGKTISFSLSLRTSALLKENSLSVPLS